MPERVTTGSEPRRTYDLRWSALDGFRVSWDTTAQPFPEDGEVIRVVEVVESGHDEQTEGRNTIARYARELARVEAQASDNNRRAERLEAELREARKALREIIEAADHWDAVESWAPVLDRARDVLEKGAGG